mmetsp:Transcript_70295/g.139318  ORF Transcript_70295/g.139318 Transcript_70295/m.139318 type:complete len:245 (-) Transcript_70295:161-895(-)
MLHFLCLVIIAGASACNPKWNSQVLPVSSVDWPWLAANVNGTLAVELKDLVGENAGLLLKDSSGAGAGKGDCKLVDKGFWGAELQCEAPALDAGVYSLFLSGDRTCGDTSYKKVDGPNVTIIEPARVAGVTPAHGPATSQTKITLQGTHFGGERLSCVFDFFAGPGAKKTAAGNPMGCSTTIAKYGAKLVNGTHATCTTPRWPGPEAAGAVCSPKMLVRLTNEGHVRSLEPVFFTFDLESTLIV